MTRQSDATGAVTGAEGVSGGLGQRDAARPSETRPWHWARRTASDLDAIAARRLAHILGWHLTDEQRRELHCEMAKGASKVRVNRDAAALKATRADGSVEYVLPVKELWRLPRPRPIKVRRNQVGTWWVTCALCHNRTWGGALHDHADAVRWADQHARSHRPEGDDQ